MPAKSRRNRGKNTPPSIKAKQARGAQNIPQTETVEKAVPSVTAQTTVAPRTPARTRAYPVQEEKTYPFIKPELWNIGILAVIMLVILGVLAFVL